MRSPSPKPLTPRQRPRVSTPDLLLLGIGLPLLLLMPLLCASITPALAETPDTATDAPLPATARVGAHNIFITTSTSDHGPFAGRIGWGSRLGRWGIGFEAGGAVAADLAVHGRLYAEGSRLRARAPLLVRLAGGDRLFADILLAPGVRLSRVDGDQALAVTTDIAFIGHLHLTDWLALHMGALFPFAFDLTAAQELALFPGLGWLAGAELGLTDHLSLMTQLTLAAPEGYGGDGAKSFIEATLCLSYAFDAASVSGWVPMPEHL
jgi:hypothetical protein